MREGVKKLVPNLFHKKRYTIHHATLQLYLSLGIVLENIHDIIEFNQSTWLAEYIRFNSEMRAAAYNDEFSKDFYKLMNNSVFGNFNLFSSCLILSSLSSLYIFFLNYVCIII